MIMHGPGAVVAPYRKSRGRSELARGFGVDEPLRPKPCGAGGQQRRPRVDVEGRIEKHHVEAPRLAGREGERVCRMRFKGRKADHRRRLDQRAYQRGIAIDRHGAGGAARQRFEGEHPAPGIKLERRLPGQILAKPVEQRLPHAIRGGTKARGSGKPHDTPAVAPADDADALPGCTGHGRGSRHVRTVELQFCPHASMRTG